MKAIGDWLKDWQHVVLVCVCAVCATVAGVLVPTERWEKLAHYLADPATAVTFTALGGVAVGLYRRARALPPALLLVLALGASTVGCGGALTSSQRTDLATETQRCLSSGEALPPCSASDATDCGGVDSVASAESPLRLAAGPDLQNVSVGEFRPGMSLAARAAKATAAALSNAIGNVVRMSPEEQVIDVYASSVVASMADAQSFGDRPMRQFPREPVSPDGPARSGERERAVAVLSGNVPRVFRAAGFRGRTSEPGEARLGRSFGWCHALVVASIVAACGGGLTNSQRASLATETQVCLLNERAIVDRMGTTAEQDAADLAAERARCDAARAAIVGGGR